MKKLLLIATMTASLSGLTAFGQGYFAFVAGTKTVWDDWSQGGVPRLTANSNKVAFLWAPSGSSSLLSVLMNGTPTNGAASVNPTAAWNAILNDPLFHLAQNNSLGDTNVIQNVGNGGAFSYNANTQFPVTGTSSGQNYAVYVIGWNVKYATPQLAAAGGSELGWSPVFTYNAVAVNGFASTFSATPGFGPFGILPVPEPATFALAGLGAAAMLIFRRRK